MPSIFGRARNKSTQIKATVTSNWDPINAQIVWIEPKNYWDVPEGSLIPGKQLYEKNKFVFSNAETEELFYRPFSG